MGRCFYPNIGIAEDPVTGSAHCALAPFWAAKLGKASLRCLQASARGGEVLATVAPSGTEVLLSGRAVTVVRGEIAVPL